MTVFGKWVKAGLVFGAVAALGGCKASEPASPKVTPMPMPQITGPATSASTMAVPATNQAEVAIPTSKPPAAKDLTHVLEKDQLFFLDEPGANPKPVGTLKAGTKVLMLIPGLEYTQVLTEMGILVYTPTDGLKPLGK